MTQTVYTPQRPLDLVLLSPKGPLYRKRGGIFKRSLRYQPLTLTTLSALVPKSLPVNIRLIDESIEELPEDFTADLVAMTVITGMRRAPMNWRHRCGRKISPSCSAGRMSHCCRRRLCSTLIQSAPAIPSRAGRSLSVILWRVICSVNTVRARISRLISGLAVSGTRTV